MARKELSTTQDLVVGHRGGGAGTAQIQEFAQIQERVGNRLKGMEPVTQFRRLSGSQKSAAALYMFWMMVGGATPPPKYGKGSERYAEEAFKSCHACQRVDWEKISRKICVGISTPDD